MAAVKPLFETRFHKKLDVYMFLTHAMDHCRFGSAPEDREPTQADIDAARILLKLRCQVQEERAASACPDYLG